MINKNVLFPVDTEAYHVIFSCMMTLNSFNNKNHLFSLTTVFVQYWLAECDSLLPQKTPVASKRKVSAGIACMTNSSFNDVCCKVALNHADQPRNKVTTAT